MSADRIKTESGHTVHAKAEWGKVGVCTTFGGAGTWFDLTADEARKLAELLVAAADALPIKVAA